MGEAHTLISSVEPVIRLYQDHPLFGMEYWNALGANATIDESQMTFAAIPYFAPVASADDAQLLFAWRINGKDIEADGAAPNKVTLSAPGSATSAQVALELTHQSNLFLDARGSWNIFFAAGPANDPFRNGTF
jgi:hypothetical protein